MRWGKLHVRAADRADPLPVRERYACVWTSLGAPIRDLPSIPEADEADRRHVVCGAVAVKASGLRIVENFLDMAHFPFVHTHILGAEPNTKVLHYTTEIRRDVDEVWATNCQFFQPRAAVSAGGGTMTRYQYRVFENQRPVLLPLEPRAEIPTRADGSSVAYRRWLKETGIVYGTAAGPAGAQLN